MRENDIIFTLWYMVHMFVRSLVINSTPIYKLAQAALRAPPEVALECVAGHCYYQLSVSLFLSSLSVFCFWPTSGNLLRLKISVIAATYDIIKCFIFEAIIYPSSWILCYLNWNVNLKLSINFLDSYRSVQIWVILFAADDKRRFCS